MLTLRKVLIFIIIVCLSSCSSETVLPIGEPSPPMYAENGKYLVKTLAACGFCHSENASTSSMLSGGREIQNNSGNVITPNITSAVEATGNWSIQDFLIFFRTYQKPDQSIIQSNFHNGFEWISENDLISIASYLKTIPAVEGQVNEDSGLGLDPSLGIFNASKKIVKGYVPDIDKAYQKEYGKYLVKHVARCVFCHNTPATLFDSEKYLEGGASFTTVNDSKVAPNITQDKDKGIGSWSEEAILKFFRTAKTPKGKLINKEFCPVDFYKEANTSDLLAMASYLKSL